MGAATYLLILDLQTLLFGRLLLSVLMDPRVQPLLVIQPFLVNLWVLLVLSHLVCRGIRLVRVHLAVLPLLVSQTLLEVRRCLLGQRDLLVLPLLVFRESRTLQVGQILLGYRRVPVNPTLLWNRALHFLLEDQGNQTVLLVLMVLILRGVRKAQVIQAHLVFLILLLAQRDRQIRVLLLVLQVLKAQMFRTVLVDRLLREFLVVQGIRVSLEY